MIDPGKTRTGTVRRTWTREGCICTMMSRMREPRMALRGMAVVAVWCGRLVSPLKCSLFLATSTALVQKARRLFEHGSRTAEVQWWVAVSLPGARFWLALTELPCSWARQVILERRTGSAPELLHPL